MNLTFVVSDMPTYEAKNPWTVPATGTFNMKELMHEIKPTSNEDVQLLFQTFLHSEYLMKQGVLGSE